MNKFAFSSLFVVFYLFFSGNILFAQDRAIQSESRRGLDLPTRKIEDDSALRTSLENTWFKESTVKVLSKKPETHTLRGGGRVQVRIETSSQNREEFAIVLAREQNNEFPGWAQGSWVMSRKRDSSGEATRIRVFLRSDYNTYIQFRPFSEEKCLLDVLIYNGYVIRSLPLPIPFERLYVLSIEEILSLAGDSFPRRYFEPEPGAYRDSRAFIAAVRSRLPEIRFLDDGAQDEKGNFVFIKSLEAQGESDGEDGIRGGVNCSGFAKWLVDGILRPHTGERLPVTPLKMPFGIRGSSLTEPWEESRDPFFGLDWCRNLASKACSVLRSPSFGSREEIEVNDWPFYQVLVRQPGGTTAFAYPGYLQNAGFGFEGLQALLYTLAVDEPGRIYLAAVNDERGPPVTPDNPRGLPRIRQYYHIAILVPYFNERGVFQVAVFESAEETSFSRFRTRYPGQFVNLVRIPIEDAFDP